MVVAVGFVAAAVPVAVGAENAIGRVAAAIAAAKAKWMTQFLGLNCVI